MEKKVFEASWGINISPKQYEAIEQANIEAKKTIQAAKEKPSPLSVEEKAERNKIAEIPKTERTKEEHTRFFELSALNRWNFSPAEAKQFADFHYLVQVEGKDLPDNYDMIYTRLYQKFLWTV